ncbi:hypothetical protein Trydic_g23025 [Trypoxylus dichotomus]
MFQVAVREESGSSSSAAQDCSTQTSAATRTTKAGGYKGLGPPCGKPPARRSRRTPPDRGNFSPSAKVVPASSSKKNCSRSPKSRKLVIPWRSSLNWPILSFRYERTSTKKSRDRNLEGAENLDKKLKFAR